jgi:hypothetical protein
MEFSFAFQYSRKASRPQKKPRIAIRGWNYDAEGSCFAAGIDAAEGAGAIVESGLGVLDMGEAGVFGEEGEIGGFGLDGKERAWGLRSA